MKDNTQEKSLVQVNENSIFYKIKSFFRNLFRRNKFDNEVNAISNNTEYISTEKETTKNAFMESIRNIEDEETKLLKLQKQYDNGEIKEEDLTQEQYNSLCELYDKQIAELKKSNEIRKHRLLEYRRKLHANA